MVGSAPLRRVLDGRATPVVVTAVLTAAGATLATWPLALNLGTAALRDGEVLLSAWQLNWYQHAILTRPWAWADANIFFPYDRAVAFNDLLLSHALVTLPAAWWSSPVLALNLALLGGIVFTAVCTYLLIEHLTAARWAAAIGGILFALAPFRFLHVGHLSIAAAWPIPLFFWALLRHLDRPSWGRALGAGVCGVLMGVSSIYNAAYAAPLALLILLFGARRAAGRSAWGMLLATAVPGLALLLAFFAPFAAALQSYGTSSAPDDLLRYGAELSSLGHRPHFLGGAAASATNAEAHLYPGAALACLAVASVGIAAGSVRSTRGWRLWVLMGSLVCLGAAAVAVLSGVTAVVIPVVDMAAVAVVWIAPVALTVWAIGSTTREEAAGPALAIRLGLAGGAIAFALALGPEVRVAGRALGPAPYLLLTQMSSAFEGTRVPARFGGVMLLFLTVSGAGALAALLGSPRRAFRIAGGIVAVAAVLACAAELPVPPLPQGHSLVAAGRLRDRAYGWIADRPGRFGILELPDWPPHARVDYRVREWRSLRYMLAAKQHHQHLVNGTGRIEPFLWRRFRGLEPWSDAFFRYVVSYFPVDYVLVHEGGIPAEARDTVWSRVAEQGWREVFRSRIRIYSVDRSFGRGTIVDRLFLREWIAPSADVRFDGRLADEPATGHGATDATPSVLELLRDGDVVAECSIGASWQPCAVNVSVVRTVSNWKSEWPRTATLLRWQVRGNSSAVFEIKNIAVTPAGDRQQ